ncbi:HisA/HisF-related TIM barrel protein [Streptomyces sp. NPDC050982]|uniref:HisA/HisF-related TIM barrel protein n=1 Tax=Streptomyces sp. NPDC050982 TaxID=3154746 RepID=UPI0033DC1669
MDAVQWPRRGEELGAGEICVNSIDQHGTHEGYELDITKAIAYVVNVPVIASGGAGVPEHVTAAFVQAGVSGAIVSSLMYSPRRERTMAVGEIKTELAKRYSLPVRRV